MDELRRRFEEQRAEARRLASESAAEGLTDERRAELRAQADTAAEAAEATLNEIEREKRLKALDDVQLPRLESATRATDRAADDILMGRDFSYEPVEVDAIMRRTELNYRAQRGERLTDEQTVEATRIYPVERLLGRHLVEMARPGASGMTSEQRKAWVDHAGRMEKAERALSNAYNTATANQGGSLIPETLATQIFAAAAYTGPFADDTGLTVFRNEVNGKFNLPTIEGADKAVAGVQAEGADGTIARLSTGIVELTPVKFAVHRAASWEMLTGDYVSLEAWLSRNAGQAFGRQMNADRTTGGNGIVGAAPAKSVTARVATFTGTLVNEAAVTALVKLLDVEYWARPGAMFQMHANTELDLLALKDGTTNARTYPRDQSGRLILPRIGNRYQLNNALDDSNFASGDLAAIVGDRAEYAVLYVGGFRVASDYEQISDQFLLSWYMSHDGAPAVPEAFAALYR